MSFKNLVITALFGMATIATSQAAILANVGERAISDDEVKADYEQITEAQKDAINKDSTTRRSIVENAINGELLLQAAKKAGLENDAEYKKALERFNRQYLASKFMQKAVEPKLVKGEIKKYYEANKNTFDSTQVCAHHIVVSDEKEAEKLAGEAKKKGTNFETLAKKYSIDPTVQDNKGNLGCFTRDRMVPEFAAAAFKMRKGEVQGPIRTMYGFHVIKVDDVKLGKIPGFEEVEQRAKETLRVKLVQELLADLRSKSAVKLHEEAVSKFKF